MTIRNRLTLRFTGLVSSILLLTFVSIYAFCWYFISLDFYRRLDRKALTTGELLIRHKIDADLIRQLGRLRKDQLPDQEIVVYDQRDSIVFATKESHTVLLDKAILADIRQQRQKDFRRGTYYISGIRFGTTAGEYVVIASAQNDYGDEFLRQLLLALTGLFCLIAAITAISGWAFAGDALRPMQQIDRTVSDIFPNNQDERLFISKEDDEISRLSMTINQLLDRVAESFRLQRMFVANVSHELKNPLTQISSQLEVSLLKQRDPDSYRQTIRSVLDDVGDLNALTHELLQLSQVNQENAANLLTNTVRLDELVWDVREEVASLHLRCQITVELGTLPDDPDQLTVQGNRTLLGTALKNLIENACKFSDDGRALVQTHFGQKSVAIQISNTGQPIPEADLPYIFQPFYRSRQTADLRGYGVGLSLVDRIIRLHGGKVSGTSTTDKQTVFTVELPR
ncbi:HAMP domain-containing sensor histidine kinase [Fibrella forsythiae]|uniref:histidine kinase n=1 Tax=Fibrella forsythiae TaxID=2817061 RepID=A0ABS3JL40_9BACT|nr:HAMP domain-containing sensor histidine kinase [Fibrella forsythiae]MBO0950721.1 HAMP domain-containing histidine kinase [Fibrella forsythiae]